MTNRDRLKLLQVSVNVLAGEIERSGREQEYLEFVKGLQNKTLAPVAVDDAEWDLMLPAEKAHALLARYHTLRTELLLLTREKDELRTSEALAQWLTSPWTKIVVGGAALVKAAVTIYLLLSNAGLFLRVPDATDS